MTIEHAEEVLNALGRDMILGQGLPVIALNMAHAQQSWAAKAWTPNKFRPKLPAGFGDEDYSPPMAELDNTKDIYVGISIFGPWTDKFNKDAGVKTIKSATYGNFMRRTKDNFVGMVAIMVDDVGDADGTMGPGAKIQASKITLAPSWKVCTSPNCWQYWYVLDTMCTEREIAERFIDDLVKSGLTSDAKDPGMRGVSRVGRLPMGLNNKPKYRVSADGTHLDAPSVYGADFTGERFSLLQIANAFGIADVYRPIERRAFGTQYSDIDAVPAIYRLTEQFLQEMGMVKHDGGSVLEISCPWLSGHSSKGDGPDDSGSKYFRPAVENGFKGGFYCWHSKCEGKHIRHLTSWVEEQAHKMVLEREKAKLGVA